MRQLSLVRVASRGATSHYGVRGGEGEVVVSGLQFFLCYPSDVVGSCGGGEGGRERGGRVLG